MRIVHSKLLTLCMALATLSCSGKASPKNLCEHLIEVLPKMQTGDIDECLKDMADMKESVGEEAFAAFSKCAMGATGENDLVGCLAKATSKSVENYQKNSQNTEAKFMVQKMYDGVRAFAMTPQVDTESLMAASPRLPAESVGPTPPLGSCCKQGGKCEPNAKDWEHPTWMAIEFAISDPFYYSYEYKKTSDTEFSVIAHGDLDCDGDYSTFTLTGSMTADGNIPPPGEVEEVKPLE